MILDDIVRDDKRAGGVIQNLRAMVSKRPSPRESCSMVSSSAESVTLGRKQLDEGQADMFTILRLAGENLAAKIEQTKVRASRLRERVNLHLALGGDFKGTGAPGK